MSRKAVSGLMLTLLLMGMLTLAFNIPPVKAIGTIYIRADGSVDPPTAPIQRNGDLYTLTGNIASDIAGIVIERNNITLDGAGYTVQGTGNEIGLDLSFRINATVKNVEIKEFEFGIYPNHSLFNTIVESILTAIKFETIRLYESSHNNITGNKITSNNVDGIVLYGSFNNTIAKNNLTDNFDGIRFYRSSNSNITENIVANNYYGVFLAVSSNNNIVKNNITANNGNGISLRWSSNENRIVENHIALNTWYGISLDNSSNNVIYRNSLVDNVQQVNINNSANVWDDGYPPWWQLLE